MKEKNTKEESKMKVGREGKEEEQERVGSTLCSRKQMQLITDVVCMLCLLTISFCSSIWEIFLLYIWSTCLSSASTPSQRSVSTFLSLIS